MAAYGNSKPADAPYLERLPDAPSELIFIMGCHRSGTSLLYHLLAYTGQLDYLSAYDIIKYDELLHNRITGNEAQVKAALQQVLKQEPTRGLDELPVGVDLPEEYRFLMGQKPPGLVLNFRKRLDKLFFAPCLTPQSLDTFLQICRKKRFLAGDDRPLALKNPADYYFNFWAVHEMLPAAKFIFIHRHPLPMLNSYLNGFTAILKERSNYAALLDKRYYTLFASGSLRRQLFLAAFRSKRTARLLLSRLGETFEYYLAHVKRLPESQYVSVRYEDLCADPVACLAGIGQQLRLNLVPRVPAKFVAPRHLPIAEHTKREYLRRSREFGAYLDYCRYEAAWHA